MSKRTTRCEEIRAKSDSDLTKELAKQREELRGLRFDVAGSKSSDTKQKQKMRRDVARLKTEMRRRELTQ